MIGNLLGIWLSINIFCFTSMVMFYPKNKSPYIGDRNGFSFFYYYFTSYDKRTRKTSVFNTLFYFPFAVLWFLYVLIQDPKQIKWKRVRC